MLQLYENLKKMFCQQAQCHAMCHKENNFFSVFHFVSLLSKERCNADWWTNEHIEFYLHFQLSSECRIPMRWKLSNSFKDIIEFAMYNINISFSFTNKNFQPFSKFQCHFQFPPTFCIHVMSAKKSHHPTS